jgi:hypothetical protein
MFSAKEGKAALGKAVISLNQPNSQKLNGRLRNLQIFFEI